MMKACKYCGEKIDAKSYAKHISEIHEGMGKEFRCSRCARCCTDEGAPLEITLRDILRISSHLKITPREFFEKYCSIAWSGDLKHGFIPTIVIPFPCKFLNSNKCTIYEIRPLHCRLFPERLFAEPNPVEIEPFYKAGYNCIDTGFKLSNKRKREIKELMEVDREEILETANFFENFTFSYSFESDEYAKIIREIKKIDKNDKERNKKKREIIESKIPEELRKVVKSFFIEKLELIED